MMKKGNDDKKPEYIEAIKNWIKSSQPEVRNVQELRGKTQSELEEICQSHYIHQDEERGNLELSVHDGIISCMLRNGVCTAAYFLSNEEEEDS